MAQNAQTTEKLRVHQVVSEKTQQVVVRGKVTVPEAKPDVDKILSTDKTVKIEKTEVVPDKVIVEGNITLQVVYIAFEPAHSVHHMHAKIPFTAFVDVPGAEPGMEVQVRAAIEDVNIAPSSDDARVFDVAAVLSVFAKITEVQDVDILTECPAGATCKSETIKIDHVVASKTKQVVASDVFHVPEEKPSAEKILDTITTAEVTNIRVLKNKVIVDGNVKINIIYVAMEPEQSVHEMHRTFSFNDFIEVPGVRSDSDVRVDVEVESADVDQHTPDRLSADVVLMLTARAFETKQVKVITEISGAQAKMARLKIDHVVGEDSTQVVLRDTFSTPDPEPVIEKVLKTSVDKAEVRETRILRDKVIIRGDIYVEVTYVASLPEQPVHVIRRKIPFHTFVEIPGVEEGMDIDVTVESEYATAGYELCHITIELVIKVTAKAIETMQKDVVVEAEVPAPTPVCPPGEIIDHTVQSGDTFYSIAKKYGTTVEAIIQANPGINPENLQVGQVIKVPCTPPAKG